MTFANRKQQAAVMAKLRQRQSRKVRLKRFRTMHNRQAREFTDKVLQHRRFKQLPPDRRNEAKKAMSDLNKTSTQEQAFFIVKKNRKLIREIVTDLSLVGVPVWITPIRNIPKLKPKTKELIKTEKTQFQELRRKGFSGREAVLIIKDRELRAER